MTLVDTQKIEKLREWASGRGDAAMVATCNRALGGNAPALEEVANVMAALDSFDLRTHESAPQPEG